MTESGRPNPNLPATAPTAEARERVVQALTRHFAEDRLTMEEFERRVELAYAAPNAAQLAAVAADLGVEPGGTRTLPARLSAVFSSQERTEEGTVPRHLQVSAVFANVELDFRRATFLPGVSVVEVSAVFGNIEISVPAGVRLDMSGSAFLGSFASKPGPEASGEVVLRVVGRAVLGNVEARGPRLGAPSAFARMRDGE